METRQRDGWVYRRRRCKKCKHIYPTEERVREKTRGLPQVCVAPYLDGGCLVATTTATCDDWAPLDDEPGDQPETLGDEPWPS